jgi:hypothetical protein
MRGTATDMHVRSLSGFSMRPIWSRQALGKKGLKVEGWPAGVRYDNPKKYKASDFEKIIAVIDNVCVKQTSV